MSQVSRQSQQPEDEELENFNGPMLVGKLQVRPPPHGRQTSQLTKCHSLGSWNLPARLQEAI